MAKRSSKRRRQDAAAIPGSVQSLDVRGEVFQRRCMLRPMEAPEMAFLVVVEIGNRLSEPFRFEFAQAIFENRLGKNLRCRTSSPGGPKGAGFEIPPHESLELQFSTDTYTHDLLAGCGHPDTENALRFRLSLHLTENFYAGPWQAALPAHASLPVHHDPDDPFAAFAHPFASSPMNHPEQFSPHSHPAFHPSAASAVAGRRLQFSLMPSPGSADPSLN